MRRPALAAEAGATLVEVLAAVALLGIAFLVILGGMMTSAVGSDINAKQADGDTAVRAYAERVADAPYVSCASTAAYAPGAVSYSAPAGFTASATEVRYWQPTGNGSSGSFNPSCSTDQGLQRITVSVASSDGRVAVSREIVKRKP